MILEANILNSTPHSMLDGVEMIIFGLISAVVGVAAPHGRITGLGGKGGDIGPTGKIVVRLICCIAAMLRV